MKTMLWWSCPGHQSVTQGSRHMTTVCCVTSCHPQNQCGRLVYFMSFSWKNIISVLNVAQHKYELRDLDSPSVLIHIVIKPLWIQIICFQAYRWNKLLLLGSSPPFIQCSVKHWGRSSAYSSLCHKDQMIQYIKHMLRLYCCLSQTAC